MTAASKALTTTTRPVLGVVPGMAASDGAGVKLQRLIGQPRLRMLDPFLMLDFFSSENPDDYMAGFPEHPHRGFETVTYMISGRIKHADNKGNEGIIETGGIQWMTAARGIVHSEMPERVDGKMQGFQLWVNLPAKLKMSEPKYQEFTAAEITAETRDGAVLKIVAGETSRGSEGPVRNVATAPFYADVHLQPGAEFVEPIAPGNHVFLALYEGGLSAAYDDGEIAHAKPVGIVVLGDGDEVRVTAGPEGAKFLLVAGKPIGEPVAWGGPFVMNTKEEVMKAYEDYASGNF